MRCFVELRARRKQCPAGFHRPAWYPQRLLQHHDFKVVSKHTRISRVTWVLSTLKAYTHCHAFVAPQTRDLKVGLPPHPSLVRHVPWLISCDGSSPAFARCHRLICARFGLVRSHIIDLCLSRQVYPWPSPSPGVGVFYTHAAQPVIVTYILNSCSTVDRELPDVWILSCSHLISRSVCAFSLDSLHKQAAVQPAIEPRIFGVNDSKLTKSTTGTTRFCGANKCRHEQISRRTSAKLCAPWP